MSSGDRDTRSHPGRDPDDVLLYQPFLDEAQRQSLSSASIPFDIAFNTGPDTREYECFKALQARHRAAGLGHDVFWGLVSSKFELKTAMPLATFAAAARAARVAGFDCWACNPMIANAALYDHVWQQGTLSGHTGMDVIAHRLAELGYAVEQPQGTATFFLCNYVCGNEAFWTGYFAFCEEVLGHLDAEVSKGTPVGQLYRGGANYGRDSAASMRPFVIERLLGLYLDRARAAGLKVGVYAPVAVDFDRKFGARLGAVLHGLYATKNAAIARVDRTLFLAWHEARLPLLQQPALPIHADDPPNWLLNRPATLW